MAAVGARHSSGGNNSRVSMSVSMSLVQGGAAQAPQGAILAAVAPNNYYQPSAVPLNVQPDRPIGYGAFGVVWWVRCSASCGSAMGYQVVTGVIKTRNEKNGVKRDGEGKLQTSRSSFVLQLHLNYGRWSMDGRQIMWWRRRARWWLWEGGEERQGWADVRALQNRSKGLFVSSLRWWWREDSPVLLASCIFSFWWSWFLLFQSCQFELALPSSPVQSFSLSCSHKGGGKRKGNPLNNFLRFVVRINRQKREREREREKQKLL